MRELQVGDRVLTGKNTFEPVYAFAHRDTKRSLEFIRLSMDGSNSIELSKEHFIYVNGKVARTDMVKVGDLLLLDGSPTKVTKISKVNKKGMYAPLTASGTIFVNGVKASTYVALHSTAQSDSEKIKINGVTVPFIDQDLGIHLTILPLRVACTWTGSSLVFCQGAHDTEDGYNPFVAFGIGVLDWAQDQLVILQVFMLLAALCFFLLACAIEACVLMVASANPFGLLLVFISVKGIFNKMFICEYPTKKVV